MKVKWFEGFPYHVYQYVQRLPFPALDQLGSVVFRPFGLVVLAEVAAESLASPVAVAGVGDGREGGDGFVFTRVLQKLAIPYLSAHLPVSLPAVERRSFVPTSEPRAHPYCARRC